MSAVVSQPPPGTSGWVCLRSTTLSRIAAIELLSDQALNLSDDMRQTLTKLTLEQPQEVPLRLWVQLDGVSWIAQGLQEKERRDAALRILILRQANFPLIRRLFNLSRDRWIDMRKELNAPPAPKSVPQPAAHTVDDIYASWSKLIKEYDNEIDRWVVLAQQFPYLPLAALYPLIYIPGAST
ncbi:hypothetical protein B9Z51_07155 [Limnohabitans sp. T6-5]|uniref:hypothetical protein n=1 Tax=Limnohabitans sp. T6-5 TaxID=1100724 RepID=UPI000D3B8259|nr:hypothetical protein [Limnohabitans sp. T6-5]PUE08717.1 hypothetical protein B9Z51_07155 [Limnohabitans sp. T6-5]